MTTGKKNSFANMNLCQRSGISFFLICCQVCHSFPSKEQACFNLMAEVTFHSDFGAQEDKICHCFHFEVMGPDSMILVF